MAYSKGTRHRVLVLTLCASVAVHFRKLRWYGLYEAISQFQSLYVTKQLLRLMKLGDREILLHTEHGNDIRNNKSYAVWMNCMTLIKCSSSWINSRHTCIRICVYTCVHIAGRRDEILPVD